MNALWLRQRRIRYRGLAAIMLLVSLLLMASTAAQGASKGMTTVTLWSNFGPAYNGTATQKLASAFERTHPNIKINVVSQPAGNYFALLQAAAISHTGPDLVVMWGGLYAIQHESYLQNLKSLVPASATKNLLNMRWASVGIDVSKGVLMMPLENQFYASFYNKTLFHKAGIATPPRTWNQLYADCAKLKAAGVPTCVEFAEGDTNQTATGEFYPWYDMSYLVIGAIPLKQLEGLYNGSIKWTDPRIVSQLTKWQALYKKGYTNKDVLTAHNVMTAFESGQAAIMTKGNWVVPSLTQTMGTNNVGVMVPPFSDKPIAGVTEFPGDGYSMTTYSQHKQQAAEFLQFLTTNTAAQVINAYGIIPDVKGYRPSNALSKQLLNFGKHMTDYPLVDNALQGGVVDAATSVLPEMLAGQVSPEQAAQKIEAAWQALPASQRGSSWGSYTAAG